MTEATLTVRERDLMYRMIVSQLLHDGFLDIAAQLGAAISAVPDCPPANRLQHVVQLGLRHEPEREQIKLIDTEAPGTGIDLEFDTDVQTLAPEAAQYETCYVTAHKGECRIAAWSKDGQLVATGSADASIKILDCERMLAKSANMNDMNQIESHPVIRTLYDHIEDVTALDFHPSLPILVSGSKDFTVKFFDYSKSAVKRAFRSVQEAEQIRAVSFHPSGDFLLVGTNHPTLRLYDVNTMQCFVSSNPNDQHNGPITAVKYAPHGNIYSTCSKDGTLKLWDGVSNRCINTFKDAHGGSEVCSVEFARNGKYMLTSGKDSLVKLWELSTARVLITYTGAGLEKQNHRTQAVFNHTEDYVFFPDERTTSLCCWDSRNAERNKLLSLGICGSQRAMVIINRFLNGTGKIIGHNNVVRCIVHSPTSPGFMTCSDDYRARFWYYRPNSD